MTYVTIVVNIYYILFECQMRLASRLALSQD